MPIFERPPIETLAPAKDRWTPIYLEDDPNLKAQCINLTSILAPFYTNTIIAFMNQISDLIQEMGRKAKEAALKLAVTPTAKKNKALLTMASQLEKSQSHLIAENEKDMAQARKDGLNQAMLDRLKL